MVIQHNLSAMNAHRQTGINNKFASKNLEKLSSGYKINRAADDAAGLAISEKMRGQIRGTMMGTQNVNMGINLVQSAEGGLNETHDILNRMRELAVQASNGTYSDDDRAQIDKEFQALKNEVDRIATSTHYNGIKLLDVPAFEQVVGPSTPADPANFLSHLSSLSSTPSPISSNGRLCFNATNAAGTSTCGMIYPTGGGFSAFNWSKLRLSDGNSTVDLSLTNDGRLPDYMTFSSIDYYDASSPGGERWESIHTYNQNGYDVTLKQTVNIIHTTTNVDGEDFDSEFYNISYEILNNAAADVTASFLFHVDTEFTSSSRRDDNPSFNLNGTVNSITRGTVFGGSNLPETVDLYNNTDRNMNARIIVDGIGIVEAPDELRIGAYSSVDKIDYSGGESIYDSGYSILWSNRTIASGSSLNVNTMYGVTDPMMNPELAAIPGEPVLKSTELWIQSGANLGDGMYIKRCDARSPALGIDKSAVDPLDAANKAIGFIDNACNIVSSYRADFGASNNRLESMASNNGIKAENLQAAESSIRDVDMAKEMMEFTKNNILSQAAQSMLAQSNQLPQGILQLLKAS